MIKPLGANILVKPIDDMASKVGLVLPTADKEKKQKGEVIALGTGLLTPEGKAVPFNVKIGDQVFFKKYSPEEIEIEGIMYYIMEERDILGVL